MWVALELTAKGESSGVTVLTREVRKVLPRASVYVPVVEDQVGEDRVSHSLLEGYIFVEEADPPRNPRLYGRFTGGRLIEKVLFAGGKPAYISNEYIDSLRQSTKIEAHQGIGVGDLVDICSGPYKSIEATVILDLPAEKNVQVYVQLRSKQTLLTLPRSALKVLSRTSFSHVHARVSYIKMWFNVVRFTSQFSLDLRPVNDALSRLERVGGWYRNLGLLSAFLEPESLDSLADRACQSFAKLERLQSWVDRGRYLYPFVLFDERTSGVAESLAKRVQHLEWLSSRCEALSSLTSDVLNLNRQIEREATGSTVSDVFVDGPSLLRHFDVNNPHEDCVASLLELLGDLGNRYSGALIRVLWGQQDSRISENPEYMPFYVTAFRKTEKSAQSKISALGYSQLTCERGNVLDILCSVLEQDDLEDVVIYSADKNILQLVDGTTSVIYPAKGSRKEIFYDLDKVVEHFQVPPDSIPDLLALLGNIYLGLSCVQRIPKGILRAMVTHHLTLDSVYSHGLSDLDHVMYDRIRTAEAKARLHLKVLRPRDVSVSSLTLKA